MILIIVHCFKFSCLFIYLFIIILLRLSRNRIQHFLVSKQGNLLNRANSKELVGFDEINFSVANSFRNVCLL